MARTSKQDEEPTFHDLPPWAQATIALFIGGAIFWALVPRWVFYLTLVAMAASLAALGWNATQKHASLWGALKAGVSGYREIHASWEGDQEKAQRASTLSSYQKSKLKKAVGLQCEHPQCSISRSLHVHHITPRSESGGNELANLIVLCRNHHADADAGSLSRSVLRELIRGDRFQDEGVKEYWAKSAAA